MPARRDARTPTLRVRTPESTAAILKAHVARHNLRVWSLAGGTLLASVTAWLLLYLAGTWVVVFAVAFFDLPYTRIPRGFNILFSVTAICALAYTWLDNRLTPNERPSDKKSLLEIASDFILAIPRMTLSIAGTLAARQKWAEADYLQAAVLLHRIAEKRRLPMSAVRLEIPDPDTAPRVMFGLQITQVIEVQREDDEFWLKLSPLRPESLKLSREIYADA